MLVTCDVLSDAGAGHGAGSETLTDPRDVSHYAPQLACLDSVREVQCNQQVMNMRKLGTFLSQRRALP